MLHFETCPVCNSSALRRSGDHRAENGDVFALFRCQSCRHGFLNPMPEMSELATYYSADYAPYERDHALSEAEIALAKRSGELRHVKIWPEMDLLDYGCGAGAFLRAAHSLGARICGIEPSSLAAGRAREAGLDVYLGTIADFLNSSTVRNRRFDLITANHVLEHVPEPVETLRQLATLLKSNGKLWVAVPNFGCWGSRSLGAYWHSADIPRHVHHFTIASLSECMTRANLSVERIRTESLVAGVANSIKRWLKSRTGIPFRLSTALRVIDGPVARQFARRMDRSSVGEALVIETRRPVHA